jgi:hypothetical protein
LLSFLLVLGIKISSLFLNDLGIGYSVDLKGVLRDEETLKKYIIWCNIKWGLPLRMVFFHGFSPELRYNLLEISRYFQLGKTKLSVEEVKNDKQN